MRILYSGIVLLLFFSCSTVQNGELFLIEKDQKVAKLEKVDRVIGENTYTYPEVTIWLIMKDEPAIVTLNKKTNVLTIDFLQKKPSLKELKKYVWKDQNATITELDAANLYRPLFDRQFGDLFQNMIGNPNVEPQIDVSKGPLKDVQSKPFREKLYSDYIFKGTEFTYYRKGAAWQPMTIPFKFRFKTENEVSQVSAGFSVGLGYNMTTSKSIYQPLFRDGQNKVVATEPSQRVLAFSPFLGLTSMTLNNTTTNGVLADDMARTNFGASGGFMITVDINKVDIGAGLGVDFGFGPNSSDWIYHGQPWIGVSLGLDIIK